MLIEISRSDQARWFRRARRSLGLSVRSMADHAGVVPRTVNAWENENQIDLPSRERLFRYLLLINGNQRLPDPALMVRTLRKVQDSPAASAYTALSQESKQIVTLLIEVLHEREKKFTSYG